EIKRVAGFAHQVLQHAEKENTHAHEDIAIASLSRLQRALRGGSEQNKIASPCGRTGNDSASHKSGSRLVTESRGEHSLGLRYGQRGFVVLLGILRRG